jgi:hypothetical protein
MNSDIEDALRRWIRAEYQFRRGHNCHTSTTQDLYVAAEEELRAAFTGHKDLDAAAKHVGISGFRETATKAPVPQQVQQPSTPRVPRQRLQQAQPQRAGLTSGFFT